MKQFVLLLCLFAFTACNRTGEADLIIENARVYSLSWGEPSAEGVPSADAPFSNDIWRPDAEAIAVKDGLIVFVGTGREANAYKGEQTRVIDANGATILPGLIESHGHLPEIGEWAEELDLRDLSEKEIIQKVYERSKEVPEGEWITGSGWDEAIFADNYPDMKALSELVPRHPVVLRGMRGFGVLGNDLAFEKAGISSETEAPLGGEIFVKNNELTNVLLNNARSLLLDKIPPKSLERKKRIVSYSLEQLLRAGYVTTHHAGVRSDYMPAYEALYAEGNLPLRLHALIATTEPNRQLVEEWIAKGPTQNPADFLQVRSFKAFYDGSLGSRGAKLLEAYSDMPGESGVSGEQYGFDSTLVREVMKAGFQLAIHCIGDRGNRDILDFYERSFQLIPEARKHRNRIEHAQIVHPDDFSRFSELNLIASMEPAHAVEDMPWAIDRVGEERVKGAYAWRTFRQNNTAMIFNSDFAGSDYNFFYGIHSAVTRKKRNDPDQRAWQPEQALTIEEAIRAYTIWGAYASQHEKYTGTIEAGKWADLTMMDIDPFHVAGQNPTALLSGKILKTIVNGKVVYEGDK